MQIKPKIVTAFFLLVLLTACAAPSYQVPPPSDVSISRAVTEINSARNRPAKSVSMAEANAAVEGVMHRLKPKAQSLCNYLAERSSASCRNWQVTVEDNNEFNAYATGSNEIVIYKGIIEQTYFIDEVALVLAHELSHHILNHINESGTNTLVGKLVGAMLGAAIAAYALGDVSCNPQFEDCNHVTDVIGDTVETGANAGGYIANQTYSVAQESEADLIAAYILFDANFDLKKAREVILQLATENEESRTRSSFFDTHPVGPERLAQFDNVIKEVMSNPGTPGQ
tara:strand:- start:2001 stop:2852 length:852 start_codon:yes stop_codon:yes gene_type:complete